MQTTFLRQVAIVFGRSVRLGRRDPALAFMFPVLFPVFMIVLFSQVYHDVARVPGFPAADYVSWIAPAVLLMAAMFGAGHSAQGLVTDAQTGFLDRLRLLPMSPAALLLGRLLFDVARVTATGMLVLAVRLKGLKPEALAGLVPLFLPISLLSKAYVPGDVLPQWVRLAAAVNPYTYVVEGVRDFMAGRGDLSTFAAAAAAALVVIALTQLAAARRFRRLVVAD